VTGLSTVISEEEYTNTEESTNSTGRVLEAITTSNGLIYALGRTKTNGVYQMQIMVYNREGELQKTFPASAVTAFLGLENPLGFRMVGDYFALQQYSTPAMQLFKIEGETVVAVTEVLTDASISAGSWSQDKCPYFYWAEAPDYYNDETVALQEFSVLDTRNGSIRQCKVEIDSENPSLNGTGVGITNENGDLLLYMQPAFLDSEAQVYWVKRQTIDRLLGE
jgi:hypothetical protein